MSGNEIIGLVGGLFLSAMIFYLIYEISQENKIPKIR